MRLLPTGWSWAALNDLQADEPAAITDGPFGSNLTSAHYTESGPRVVRLQNIGDGVFHDARAHIASDHFAQLRRHEVKPGDLLVASLGERLPRACLAPTTLGPAIVKADCIRVRLHDRVESRWVLYAMQTPALRAYAADQLHGVGRPRLGLKVIRSLPIPLPPLDEQRRIVDVLEDHLSRLDAADALLTGSLHRLQGLRRSLLHAATEGESVPLGELTVSSGYGTSAKCVVNGPGTPVVRIPNLASGRVDLTDEKRVADPTLDVSHLVLQPDDLLVVRTNGSRDLIGRAAVVQDGVVAAFASYLIRFQLDAARVRPRWVAQMLHSPALRERLESLAASSAGQYNLGLAKLNSVAIPVPPPARQDAILAELDEQMSLVAASQREVETALSRSAALRRSLLGAAFSGRL